MEMSDFHLHVFILFLAFELSPCELPLQTWQCIGSEALKVIAGASSTWKMIFKMEQFGPCSSLFMY